MSSSNSSLKAKILAGTAWTSVGVVSEKVIGIVTIAFLARLLEPKDFGTVAICSMLTGIVSTFTDIGFQSAIIQRKDNVNKAASTAHSITIIMSFLNFGLLFLLANPLSTFYGDRAIENIARVLSLNLVIGSFTRVHNFLFSRELQFGKKAVCETVPNVIYGFVAIPFAYFGFGVWSIVYGELAKTTTRTLLLFALSRWKLSFKIDPKIARELINYGKHVMFNNVLTFGAGNVDNAVVGKYMGLASLSFYKIAYNAAALPGDVLYQIIGRVIVPAFAKVQDDLGALTRQYYRVLEYASYIVLPVFCGLFILAPEFINMLYGPKWQPAVVLFRALLLFGFANVLMMFSNCLVLSTGRPSLLPKMTLTRLILVAVLLFTLLRINLLALCVGVSLLQVLLFFVQALYLRRHYHIPVRIHFEAMLSPAIFSLAMIASLLGSVGLLEGLHLNSITSLFVKVSIGASVYLSFMLFFKWEMIQRLFLTRQELGR
ncbi:membrane hypothetical protein [Candidatus Sulfobium mesophilum]|uniref:Polysaccharide biosynthesis protein n=1 Tax=Candidatus Sulfobium mesophilum TaxID=2016548 RepID=A0A2U3QDU7_9BACT|nr:membrane hypothetical protein [Candidatus Sulfobium mesophilum]